MPASRSSVLGDRYSLLAIAATALAVEIPFLHFGFPSGHDVEFHLYSWLEVLSQWKQGVFYPRWAGLAHFGYGEPRFIFYPPASWTLGAAISTIVPWTWASCFYIWIVLGAAGVSMRALARRWLNSRDALFAACLYVANPYHLLIVYWRSAFAELLASCLLPLLLLFVLMAGEKSGGERWHVVAPLSAVLAAGWLTNAPAAVMIHYSFALLIVILAWRRRSTGLLLVAAVAVVAGACLSAFYLLPAVYEQRWVHIAEAVSQGSRPQDNFLFVHTTDPDHDAFNRIVSWIAVAEIFVTLSAFAAAKRWRTERRDFWFVLAAWAALGSALMFSPTSFIWMHLPKLQFMQFPWRWLLCLSAAFSIAVTIGLPRWWSRLIVCCVMLSVIAIAWNRVQAPWWDNSADLREMQDNMATGAGYEGTDEYTPVGADPTAIDKDARRVTVDGNAHAAIHVSLWNAESKSFTAEMSAPANVAVRLFNYPSWRVEVNNRQVRTGAKEDSRQMLIPLEEGSNHVEITFVRTWDRRVGGWISAVTAMAMLVWMLFARRRRVEP
ncbi:MAG: 6-pyruvoyl-tetrahydropterin synthase-related protein [Candidatus Sulfotelmatobacter sp.]